MNPTEAPTTLESTRSSSTDDNTEVVGAVVGSASFVLLAAVVIGMICFRSTMVKICPSFLFKDGSDTTTTSSSTGMAQNQGYVDMNDNYSLNTMKKTSVNGTSTATVIQPFAQENNL